MEDTEKAELLNAFFASVCSAKAVPQASHSLEARREAWRKEDLPLDEEDCVRDPLCKLDTHKSMDINGMNPGVLREPADVIAELLSIIFERSWRTGEMPEDWRKAKVTSAFRSVRRRIQGTTGQLASPPSLER